MILFGLARRINDIIVSVGPPDLFRNDSVSNPVAVQEWNASVNVSSKGKQYILFKDNLNFEKYLINVSNCIILDYQLKGRQSSVPS